MKKRFLIGLLTANFITFNTYGQCNETYNLCSKQLSKADRKAGWNVNQQSTGISVAKGEVYEMTVMAYEGLEYRLSVCTAIANGTAATFQLAQDVVTTTTNENGEVERTKERKIIFDNAKDDTDLYVLFRSNKTEKFFVSINIPASGASKKAKDEDSVCLGLLLEHRKVKKSSL
jgi:hypothetical protein